MKKIVTVNIVITLILFLMILIVGCQEQPSPEPAPAPAPAPSPSTALSPTIPELKTANFRVSGLTITPMEVTTNSSVTIEVLVINDGEQSGTYDVKLIINDTVDATETVSLDGGDNRNVTFTITKSDAKTYVVNINGLYGSFVVKNPSFQIQSVNLCSWWIPGFKNPLIAPLLQEIKALGANTVILDWAVPFDEITGEIAIEFDKTAVVRTPSLEDVTNVMSRAQSLDLAVVLKPHAADKATGRNFNTWEVDTTKLNVSKFFEDYKQYLMQVAVLSEQKKSPFLVIGTEMNGVDGDEFVHYWTGLIADIRAVYHGKITYDALTNAVWEDIKDVKDVGFLDQLDFISLSVYPNLSQNKDASYEELYNGWFVNNENPMKTTNWVEYLESIHKENDKHIFFAEIGFASWDGAATRNFGIPEGDQDLDEQKMCIETIFDVWTEHGGDWLMGISIWQVDPNIHTNKNNIWFQNGMEFLSKPAEDVIRSWFLRSQ